MNAVYVDTDVLLDVILERVPHAEHSIGFMRASERDSVRMITSVLSIANLYYNLAKARDATAAKAAVRQLLEVVEVVPMPADAVSAALASKVLDFEDALQVETAVTAGADVIITRNIRDFRNASIPVLTPADFLSTRPQP